MQKLNIFLLLSGIILAFISCREGGERTAYAGSDDEQLARLHCGSCHAFVEPLRLDKTVWREGVLPQMALRMGVKDSIQVRMDMQESLDMRKLGIQPSEPLLDSTEWKRIVNYYMREAPDSLPPAAELPAPMLAQNNFESQSIDMGLDGGPLTTLVQWEDEEKSLYVGEGGNNLFKLDGTGSIKAVHGFNSPPVAVEKDENGGMYVLNIGHVRPNNDPRGKLNYLDAQGQVTPVLHNLPRPVAMARGDLDGDGIADLVICGFGHFKGRLSWWKGLGGQSFEERVLIQQPGALSTWIRDLDRDGLPDILTLMAQGDERIVAHYNLGDGRFREETLLRFDAVMGSSYMQPEDMDGDGDLDLVYTNGDNADFSFSRKPYHGVRVFENNGDQQFTESFFFPLYGTTKAVPVDLNGDGTLDLAAIAFFPDYDSTSPRSFVLLERKPKASGMTFGYATLPNMNVGRWLCLDTGDLDRDGRVDLILGSFTFSPTPTPPDLYRSWLDSNEDVVIIRPPADLFPLQ